MPALHRAAYYGKVKDVQDILGTGVDAGEPFDTELDEGLLKRRATSPLAIAVHNGHLDVAELLAERTANTSVGFVRVFDSNLCIYFLGNSEIFPLFSSMK